MPECEKMNLLWNRCRVRVLRTAVPRAFRSTRSGPLLPNRKSLADDQEIEISERQDPCEPANREFDMLWPASKLDVMRKPDSATSCPSRRPSYLSAAFSDRAATWGPTARAASTLLSTLDFAFGQKWTQLELAKAASIGVATVRKLEGAGAEIRGSGRTLWKIQSALEAAGVEFIPADEKHGPGVRLRTLRPQDGG
jgi:hypothetical protein